MFSCHIFFWIYSDEDYAMFLQLQPKIEVQKVLNNFKYVFNNTHIIIFNNLYINYVLLFI